ncbi:MAG TPA: HAMP domain-containing sensor histidine kinase, partial [Allocoleopsis sp.]
RLKQGIDVVKDYGELPLVNCYAGQLSQVLMNLISNAIDALMEQKTLDTAQKLSQFFGKPQTESSLYQPQIKITTLVCEAETTELLSFDRWVVIRIADNGPGITPEIQSRIFEMFFTTKPVGQGTGLGLAISHQIVTEKHQGQLNLRSQLGVGTEFEIRLPLIAA